MCLHAGVHTAESHQCELNLPNGTEFDLEISENHKGPIAE